MEKLGQIKWFNPERQYGFIQPRVHAARECRLRASAIDFGRGR
jgi:cold shock CspA family protein